MTRLQKTDGKLGADRTRLIPILYIALLVVAGAAAVVYGVATAFTGAGSILTGKLLQTTGNSDSAGSVIVQYCENQTSTSG